MKSWQVRKYQKHQQVIIFSAKNGYKIKCNTITVRSETRCNPWPETIFESPLRPFLFYLKRSFCSQDIYNFVLTFC